MTTDSFLLKINCSTVTIIIHSFADEMSAVQLSQTVCYSRRRGWCVFEVIINHSNQHRAMEGMNKYFDLEDVADSKT